MFKRIKIILSFFLTFQFVFRVNEKLNVWNLIETGEKLNNELIPFLGSDEGVEVRNIINEAFVALNDSNDFFLGKLKSIYINFSI